MYEITTPIKKQTLETMHEQIVTLLHVLKRRIDDWAGQMMWLGLCIAPIIRIPSTMVIAVKKAMSIL
jgi:hypothetical protein